MKNKIVNIINFIRGIEPRFPLDLHKPVAWQMELARKYNLPTTWLLQYDALLDDFYIGLLKQAPAGHEVGIWFEVVQPLVEACGINWRMNSYGSFARSSVIPPVPWVPGCLTLTF